LRNFSVRYGGKKQYPRHRKKGRDNWAIGKESVMDEDYLAELEKTLGPKAGASDYIDDFVHSSNDKFKGKSKEERIRMALGAYYGKRYEEDLDAELAKLGARHSSTDRDIIQTMHDSSVALGACCVRYGEHNYIDGPRDQPPAGDTDVTKIRIAKVDQALGLVMGYAVICKIDGQPYYDLNLDPDGQRVPEHIPEEAMLKASVDFMQNSRIGNEMHGGGDKGTFVFAFPLTTDIAKAMGVETRTTGLMVAYKPPPEVLAKFVDGTYKGFSIEGRRITVEEHE
jgi:hypothetical protein